MSVAIQASKANEAIQTIFDQNVNYVIPPYEIRKYGIDILIQGKMNHIQGLPSGFDLMYLALADRNMQVRFGLKVVWES